MTIVIHGIPGSPYVRQPMLACEEKGVPWRIQRLGFGEQKSPEHLKRHPFGRIPAIEHGDFALYEAQAILRYIDAAFDGPRLTPADPKAVARMSQVMNILDWYAMPSLTAAIGFNRLIAPILGRPVDEEAVAAAIPLARTCIQALAEILGVQPLFRRRRADAWPTCRRSPTWRWSGSPPRAANCWPARRCWRGSTAWPSGPASRRPRRRR